MEIYYTVRIKWPPKWMEMPAWYKGRHADIASAIAEQERLISWSGLDPCRVKLKAERCAA